jgi:hypothetical protein
MLFFFSGLKAQVISAQGNTLGFCNPMNKRPERANQSFHKHFVLLIWAFSPLLLSVYFHPKALPLG